jgi:hypothetical protein
VPLMSNPILPLYESMTAAAVEQAAAQAKYDAAKAALLSAMPENIEFSTVPEHPPIIKRVGNEIVAVTKPFIGHPYEPAP